MLGFMTNDACVGYYHAAVRIKSLLVALMTSLGAVLLPRLSFYIEQGMKKEFESEGLLDEDYENAKIQRNKPKGKSKKPKRSKK